MVNQQLAAQVGLLLKAFDEELVGAPIELPVNVFCRLAAVVESMLCKFYRETMKRAFVEARNEAFHNLSGKEIQRLIFLNFLKSVPVAC